MKITKRQRDEVVELLRCAADLLIDKRCAWGDALGEAEGPMLNQSPAFELALAGGSEEVGEASIIDYFDDPRDMVKLGLALIRAAAKEAK